MTIKIICVGKIKESYFRGAVEEYTKRLGRYCRLTIVECADEKTPDGASAETERAIKRTEGERILRQIRDNDYCIALAIQGVESPWVLVLSFLSAALIILRHRENIQRLLSGTESRFSLHIRKQ